ncbi:MAG: hypothetical protein ACHP78_07575 [Terriglobales bacterium]
MNSVFFWSGDHIPEMTVEGQVMSLSEAAAHIGPSQAKLFGFAS